MTHLRRTSHPVSDRMAAGPRRRQLKRGDVVETRRCPVCEVDGHDLRAHRGQALKRPFSETELTTAFGPITAIAIESPGPVP